jgi:5-methyltetrahydropteroyltriglutamate--homocysteine methyltransferase
MDIRAQLIGYPRIGPNRELKWALERAWSGRMDHATFAERIAELRQQHLDEQRDAIGSAVDDYFLYDEVLETALMLGIAPEGEAERIGSDAFDVLTAAARGTPEREAWEMTKWFDTNYHYVVPEIAGPVGELRPLPWREPVQDAAATWAVLGPYSLVKLSRLADGLDPVTVARSVGDALWAWARANPGVALQLDEPCLGMVMSDADVAIREAAYAGAADLSPQTTPIATVQFGRASADTVEALGRLGFAVQVALADVPAMRQTAAWEAQPEHVVAVMDGRSVWPDSFEAGRDGLARADDGKPIRLVPSTSLMFLPVTVEGEHLPAGFQFAREKARALASWPEALASGRVPEIVQPPMASWPEVGSLAARAPRPERRSAQSDLALPDFPTTTTGSLPQTTEVRQLRVRLGRGELQRDEYDREMARLITDSVAWQERMGIDVVVHGEFERTDMVEYFAEQMDGFFTTRNGWVLSYGSRCVRAPILDAPPSITEPMTVDE